MDATLSVKDLETSLTEVLDRVRGGERFVIERDGEVIATLTPLPERRKPGMTWGKSLPPIVSGPALMTASRAIWRRSKPPSRHCPTHPHGPTDRQRCPRSLSVVGEPLTGSFVRR
jgi:antitoxin (DNA-binding transcriptional repressor) of toxin-antitoxin stability system